MFEYYRRLIELRHSEPFITDGAFELLLPDHPTSGLSCAGPAHAELLVVANFSSEEVVGMPLPLDSGWAAARVVLANLSGAQLSPLPDLRLRPWESIIWRRDL